MQLCAHLRDLQLINYLKVNFIRIFGPKNAPMISMLRFEWITSVAVVVVDARVALVDSPNECPVWLDCLHYEEG